MNILRIEANQAEPTGAIALGSCSLYQTVRLVLSGFDLPADCRAVIISDNGLQLCEPVEVTPHGGHLVGLADLTLDDERLVSAVGGRQSAILQLGIYSAITGWVATAALQVFNRPPLPEEDEGT